MTEKTEGKAEKQFRKLEDLMAGNSYVSLKKLKGVGIADVLVSFTNEFGEADIQIHGILFKDGTSVLVEGEHDCAYIPELPGVDLAELEALQKEQDAQ
jgi:hypothetical protein